MKKINTILLAVILTATANLNAQQPVKKVLLEEFTTTLCGNCPPSTKKVNDWHKNNAAKSILITHHAGFGTDAMTNTDATTICNTFKPSTYGFAPAIMIDRSVYPHLDSVPYMPVGGFDTVADRISKKPAIAEIILNGTLNSSTRQLNITATVKFYNAPSATGAKRLSLILVEDSVTGTGYPAYDQNCYSSSFANTYYPGMSDANGHIVGYPHRHVDRGSINGGTWGPSGIIPNIPVVNTPYSLTTTFTVPANYNLSRLSVVAIVAEHGNKYNKYVYNAESVKLTAGFSTSSEEISSNGFGSFINACYPNPVNNGSLNIMYTLEKEQNVSFEIVDLTGKVVQTLSSEQNVFEGTHLETFLVNNLSNGLYILQMKCGDKTSHQKFLISNQ